MFVDFVVEAPRRFTEEIKTAASEALGGVSSGVFRPRFLFQETMSDSELMAIFDRIEKRGSHGVCLKTRDPLQFATGSTGWRLLAFRS